MLRSKTITLLGILFMTAVTFGAHAQAASSGNAADFYKGRNVSLMVNSNPGGGTDYMARVIAGFWKEFTGGNMIVKNEPGGGGVVAINKVYSVKPDGLTFGLAELVPHIVQPYIVKMPGVVFDPRRFNYLIRAGANPYVLVVAANLQDVKSVNDLKNIKELRFTVGEAASGNALGDALVMNYWGLNGKIVAGLKTAEMGLALARKEAHGFVVSAATAEDFIIAGFAKKPPLAVFTKGRSEWFKETPTVRELIGTQLNAEQMSLLNYMESIPGDKAMFTSPDVPKDRVAYAQELLYKIMQDKRFLSKIALRWKVWTGIQHGKNIPAFIQEALGVSPSTLANVSKVLENYITR